MIKNRSKQVLISASELKAYFSSKAKPLNHYEILKVTQTSTQDDIKSAYYELSKKYHPDVNNTPEAKKIFQQVSSAYEVLGNFNKRKIYDRDLLARGGVSRKTPTYSDFESDPLAGFYKSRQTHGSYNPDRAGASSQTKFDFDEWTRAHYGRTLRRSLKDKSSKAIRERIQKEYEKEQEKEKASTLTILSVAFVVFFAQLFYVQSVQKSLDKNLVQNKKEKR